MDQFVDNKSAGFEHLIAALKALAEPTRLRILNLLMSGELNVKDLTSILGQSQPRISRHLKLLDEAGLIQRYREGNWVYCRLNRQGNAAGLISTIKEIMPRDEPILTHDQARLAVLRKTNREEGQAFFNTRAAEWDRIRALQVGEAEVETALLELVGPGPFATMLDLGTGTARMLELFAERYTSGIGVDQSRPMLDFARARLERAGLTHAQVRHGDIMTLPYADGMADLVVLHQVLHYFDDPLAVFREAVRMMTADAKLVIVEFAPHDLEFLRSDYAHRRLGFSADQINGWTAELGFSVNKTIDLVRMGETPEGNLTVSIWVIEKA